MNSSGLRGARFQAVFGRSSYVGIGWICGAPCPISCPSSAAHTGWRIAARIEPIIARTGIWRISLSRPQATAPFSMNIDLARMRESRWLARAVFAVRFS